MAHDLDDEELKATRKMNGADRRSMNELIEELTKVNPTNLSKEGLKLFNKINEIIDRNKELEQLNKYYEKLIVNQEVEKSFKTMYEEICQIVHTKYILKSVIKEKIEELDDKWIDEPKNELEEYNNQFIVDCTSILQDLLKENKEKE